MNYQLIFTILFLIGFITILFFAEFLYKKIEVKSEYTRKFAHVFATLSSLSFVLIFQSHWYVLFLGLTFFFILYIGKKNNKFKSIDSVERKTGGSYLLPIAIYIMFYISDIFDTTLYFILPILILGISDPLAGIFGTHFKQKTRNIKIGKYLFNKTIIGSTAFFISTFLLTLITLYFFGFSIQNILILAILISLIDTFVEIISSKGIDNITVPLITFLTLFLYR
jgi:dolichol kinase